MIIRIRVNTLVFYISAVPVQSAAGPALASSGDAVKGQKDLASAKNKIKRRFGSPKKNCFGKRLPHLPVAQR